MKKLFILLVTSLFSVLMMGQKIEHLPTPSEMPKEIRQEYRKELRKAVRETKKVERGAEEGMFFIPDIERVSIPVLSKNSNNNDSWPRQKYCPDDVLERIAVECDKRVNLNIDDTKTFEQHPLFNENWFLPYSNYTNESENAPYNDHGTHVSGIAVQYLMPILENGTVKIKSNWALASSGSGSFFDVARMLSDQRPTEIEDRENNVATVRNQSFGATIDPLAANEAEYKKSVEAGTYFVVAAGNSGGETKSYPASSPYTIAVASIDQSGKRSSFSTKGDFVDIAAGGSFVVAPVPGGGVEGKSGTSMASPAVAAAAVIALSKHGIDKIPDNYALANFLMECATDIDPQGYDNQTGWGVLFIKNILDKDPDGDTPPPPPPPPTLDKYKMNMSVENMVMMWSESTDIGGTLTPLSVPYMECSCETPANSMIEARSLCEKMIIGYFDGRFLAGVKNEDEATKYTGRFAEIIGGQQGFKIVVNRTEGVDRRGLNYIHHQWGSGGQSSTFKVSQDGTFTTEGIQLIKIK